MTQRQQFELLQRKGPRPLTGAQPPHLQFSDQSPRPIYRQMSQWALVELPACIPFVRHHPTMISVPTSEAFWLDESVRADRSAFMLPPGSREFAHLHADGSWHLVISEALVEAILDAGWGERHPWYDQGVLEVMVYAPRDEAELRLVQKLVLASIEYASSTPLNAVA